MRFLYLLPIISINLSAHIDNTIHFHMINSFPQTIIFFVCIGLFLFIVGTVRAIFRRFIWESKT